MRTKGAQVVETLPKLHSFKVHHTMCTELLKLVDRISRIIPDIEASRPRCSLGMQSLCLLIKAMDKAKLILQHCSESSKLYLAVTGNAVLSRCQKARKLLGQSLGQIQNMVPVMLAAEICQIIKDLSVATFVLDSGEEEAGKAVRELLQPGNSASDSMENSEVEALKSAAVRLNITSTKAISVEKQSIQKLLDKIGPSDSTKKVILKNLLYVLKKHGKSITGEDLENVYARSEGQIAAEKSNHNSLCSQNVESDPHSNYGQYGACTNELSSVIPPEEFKCPISSGLMYDPVVIASGVTYERMWIEKWFEQGNDFCPKTSEKLAHMSLTPNIAMKDLISKWCSNNGVTIPDPRRKAEDFHLAWEDSLNSIMSFGSSLNDLQLPVDLSSISLGLHDASYNSDSSHGNTTRRSNLWLTKIIDNSSSHQSHAEMHDTEDLMVLSKLADLQWDSQCKVIEDLKNRGKCNYQAFNSASSENFLEPVFKFLSKAYSLHDVEAMRAGTRLLLEFVSTCRTGLTNLSEDAFSVLASFLESEVKGEVLAIMEELSMEELSGYRHKPEIATSSALISILKILDSDSRDFQQQAIRTLYNLSFNGEICSSMVSVECIPKLLPFFEDRALVRYCVCILKNLSDTEEGRISVAETKGCLSCVAEVLENGSHEEQEQAISVLFALCSQHVDYCQLVMEQEVLPSLFYVSMNGNDKAKVKASELLQLLQAVGYIEKNEAYVGSNLEASGGSSNQSQEKKSPKKSGFLKKLTVFSKH